MRWIRAESIRRLRPESAMLPARGMRTGPRGTPWMGSVRTGSEGMVSGSVGRRTKPLWVSMYLPASQEGRLQGIHFRAKLFLSSGRRYDLMTTLSGPEVMAEFVEGTAESFRGSKVFKSQHGIVTLFETPMVLLDSPYTNYKNGCAHSNCS